MAMPILIPAIVLVIWSIVMLLWATAARYPALAKARLPKDKMIGGRGSDLNGILAPRVMWKAHNYDHLMEQPTIFYPTVLILAVLGHGDGVNLWLAWIYVALRIVHSFWQALVNTIRVRVILFAASSFVLLGMAINALLAALGG